MVRKKKSTQVTRVGLPRGYAELLESLKARVRQAQAKALLSVNRELFAPHSQKRNDGEGLLSVTQDRSVIPRRLPEGKVVMPESGTPGYKLVEPGDFVISLRSFLGGRGRDALKQQKKGLRQLLRTWKVRGKLLKGDV